MAFHEDLAFGKMTEELVAKKLSPILRKRVLAGIGRDKHKDIHVELTFEIKSDKLTSKTNNIVVESESYGKPSGISVTTADVWIWKIESEYFWAYTKDIRDYIKEKNPRWVMGGDSMASKLYVISFFDFITLIAKQL